MVPTDRLIAYCARPLCDTAGVKHFTDVRIIFLPVVGPKKMLLKQQLSIGCSSKTISSIIDIIKNVFMNYRFSEKTRGKQTLANLVVSIGMMEIYDLSEWNSAVIDSILVNGDNYFTECIKDITEENYEIWMDDLKSDVCSIFPFSFDVFCTPVVEGTMFLVRTTQFNLYKALR